MSSRVDSTMDDLRQEVSTVSKAELLEKLRSMPPLTTQERAEIEYRMGTASLAYDIEQRYGVVLPFELP